MKIYTDIIQGTPEWKELRKWKMTASNAQPIGNNWKGLDTYIIEVMAEKNSTWEKEWYSNSDMERWVELEPIARDMYELETWNKVQEVGFIEYNEYIWASPDWLIWEDWGIEIKCVKDINHFKMILNGESEIDTKYLWQIQMNLLIAGRKFWDYVSYNPNYKKSLLIFRILPDAKKHEDLIKWFQTWIAKMKEIQSLVDKK